MAVETLRAVEETVSAAARPMKERITVTLDNEVLKWLDRKIEEKVFANRSHGFEFLIKQLALKEAAFKEGLKEGAGKDEDADNHNH